MLLTNSIIERELVLLCYRFGIFTRMNTKDLNAKWMTENILWIKLNGRYCRIKLEVRYRAMTLDDLSEYILLPKLQSFTPGFLINKYYHD